MDHDDDSMVNYSQSEVEEDDNTAPTGCLTNDPTSCHFYPIYLTNPLFGHGREQPCVVLAKYIKYSTCHKSTDQPLPWWDLRGRGSSLIRFGLARRWRRALSPVYLHCIAAHCTSTLYPLVLTCLGLRSGPISLIVVIMICCVS